MENRLVEKIKEVLDGKIQDVRNQINKDCVLETREAFKEHVKESIKFLTKLHSKDCFRSLCDNWYYYDDKIMPTIDCLIVLKSETLKAINNKIGDQMNWYYLNAYQMKLKLFIDRVCDEREEK